MAICGYLIHNVIKDNNKIILLSDTKMPDDDYSNLRTGKSLLVKGLKTILDASFDFNSHYFCNVKAKSFRSFSINDLIKNGITLIHVEDAFKKFSLENLFIAAKYHKFIVTSNCPFKIKDASSERRTILFQLANYYTADLSPFDEFKDYFFTTWLPECWNQFFSFMIRCSIAYFNNQKQFLYPNQK